jgi:hypothetical protein
MKKLVTTSLLFSRLLLFFLLFTCLAGGLCGPSPDTSSGPGGNGPGGAATDKISYSINLDNKYKVKEEGNKSFYKVPLNTNVEISSIKGGKSFISSWNVTFKGSYLGSGKDLFPGEAATWKFPGARPTLIEVQGKPVRSSTSMRTETQIVNGKVVKAISETSAENEAEDKIFVIEWFVDDEELNPDSNSLKVEFVADETGSKSYFSPDGSIDLDKLDGDTESLKGTLNLKIAITNIGDKPIDLGKFKYSIANLEFPNLFKEETYLIKEEKKEIGINTGALDFPITVKTAENKFCLNNIKFIIKNLSGSKELLSVDAGEIESPIK